MAHIPRKVLVAEHECLTAFGNASQTHESLVNGRVALRMEPVLGLAGGDPVPLAILGRRGLDEQVPPAWIEPLLQMAAPVMGGGWGTPRRPVCFASSNFGVGSLYQYTVSSDAGALEFSSPERCVAWIRMKMGWGPACAIFSHACVSAHVALDHGARLLGAGAADEVLVFSFDFLSPFVTGGFHALKILNSGMPAPFQNGATGSIGLGDGAAFAVLSKSRGRFEIRSQSFFNEMHHFTGNREDGSGFANLLAPLVENAPKLWYKGHGTGTIEAGRLECREAARALPGAPIVGWKGSLGHTLGSCGLVELVVAARAMETGLSPGTIGTSRPTFDPAVALEPFSTRAFDGVLCASNAFGGAHAGLILCHA